MKDGFQYKNDFQTPRDVAKYMVSLVPEGVRTVLEPTPGIGTIAHELRISGYEVTAPEDYFQLDRNQRFDCVVMNPPFSHKYAFGVPKHLNKAGMRLGYHILIECMQMSDRVIALMPWFTISDSDVRLRALKKWGLKSLTALPRKTFEFARIQTCVMELEKGYKGETLFKVYDLLEDSLQAELFEASQPEEDISDPLLSSLKKIGHLQSQVNALLTSELLKLNPDCSTVEEVHAKYSPDRYKINKEPEEIILSMEALEVLKQCTVEGTVVKLPSIQLDRKDYEQVKKKLELIGSKWKGGKVQGFVFKEDPTELLEQIASGEDRNLQKEFQFFATPDALAERMVELAEVEDGMDILEPSAGQGAIIKAINRATGGTDVHCYELMPLNQTALKKISTVKFLGEDFLSHQGQLFDRIIANPPFSKNQDIDHILKMYECLRPGGRLVTIASPSWTFGSQRKQREFREWLKSLNAHTEEVPADTFKESGTSIRTMLIVINKPSAEVISLTDKQAV